MDQAEGLRRLLDIQPRSVVPAKNSARVIAISSGKGGVGKTSIAVNLGIAMVKKGFRVGILDADLGLGNIDIMLGLAPKFNLSHILFGEKNLSEIATYGPQGIIIYPGGSGVQEMANLNQRKLNRFLQAIGKLDDQIDILIIDTGAGIGDNVISFLLSVDELLIVTTPEPTAVTDAYAMIKTVVMQNSRAKIRLIVNMVKSNQDALTVYRNLNLILTRFVPESINLEFLGMINYDNLIGKAVVQQVPFIVSHPNSLPSKQIEKICYELCSNNNNEVKPQGVGSVFTRIARRLRQI